MSINSWGRILTWKLFSLQLLQLLYTVTWWGGLFSVKWLYIRIDVWNVCLRCLAAMCIKSYAFIFLSALLADVSHFSMCLAKQRGWNSKDKIFTTQNTKGWHFKMPSQCSMSQGSTILDNLLYFFINNSLHLITVYYQFEGLSYESEKLKWT